MNRNGLIEKYTCLTVAIFLSVGLLCAQSAAFTLQFHNSVGKAPLVRDSLYVNSFGESFSVRSFKYYISHIRALNAAGDALKELSGEVYLVDQADTASGSIGLPALPAGTAALEFMVGVDSVTNTAGVLTGSLDPVRGMFWTWNSGYIMAKLEGKSAASRAPGNYFTYHVGGYKAGQQTARWVRLDLRAGAGLAAAPGLNDSSALTGAGSSIVIVADVLKWFKGIHDISITAQPVCHAPGSLAVLLADNYAAMFSVLNEPSP